MTVGSILFVHRTRDGENMTTAIAHRRVQGDGVNLHVAHAGDGPCVILLHGFPEDWRTWKHQIPALVSAGFAVFAPDLRG